MLKAQGLHSSNRWKTGYVRTNIPDIREGELIYKTRFHGVIKPCSTYIEFYVDEWPAVDTKIYLVLSYYEQSGNYYNQKTIKKTGYYCCNCAKSFWSDLYTNRTRDLEQDFRLGMIDREKFPEFKLED
jgi:hypothetical protein